MSTVTVSNDDASGLTFQITTPNRPLLTGQDIVFMPLDTDLNASTGSGGFDYLFVATATNWGLLS